MEIHIGSTLKKLLKQQKISHPAFAKMMGMNERGVRFMLRRKYLHAATMVKISEVLSHDIIRYLYLPENLPANAGLQKRMQEMEKEMETLKKENVMLSEMNRLLKKS